VATKVAQQSVSRLSSQRRSDDRGLWHAIDNQSIFKDKLQSMERRRHVPLGRANVTRQAPHGRSKAQGLPQVYRGRARRMHGDVYDADHNENHVGGRFRWVFSTFLAAGVGALAIGIAIFGSIDGYETVDGGQRPRFNSGNKGAAPPTTSGGLPWIAPKADSIQKFGDVQAAKHIIRENIQIRKDGRPFLQIKPYLRVVAKLAPVPVRDADLIPTFNPFKLYATQAGSETAQQDGDGAEQRTDVAIRVVELLAGILPIEDNQELDPAEVGELVARAQEAESGSIRPGFIADGAEGLGPRDQTLIAPKRTAPGTAPANTTVLAKTTVDTEDTIEDLERGETRSFRAARGDTISSILTKLNTNPLLKSAMVAAAKPIMPDNGLQPGHEVQVTLVPSLTRRDRMEPARLSVYADGHSHKLSVNRNAAGEFVGSATPFESQLNRAVLADSATTPQNASLYASLYHAALVQGVQPETIEQILRIHAYETDFRKRIRGGDQVDYFFDVKEEAGADTAPGELLFTSIVTGGEVQRFWRFRSSDGVVDYYDEFGNNSRKFLMRRPIRGETVHFMSGFGMRRHPILGFLRMHGGVDWAAPIGTPIMAAGSGVVEEARWKGENGNYTRIRHANGYSTTYAHQSRFAPGITEGAKVRQGQVIGFIGSTGLSTGPHLHYEILVNNRQVDPMAIQVPQERRLTGKMLAEFQKERSRIDDLMRRPPVMTHPIKN
jgi:murein DD-endopeptidase MepM/ murein hydrolase activator NlpD